MNDLYLTNTDTTFETEFRKKNNAQIVSTLKSDLTTDKNKYTNKKESDVNKIINSFSQELTSKMDDSMHQVNDDEFHEFKIDFLKVLTTLQSVVKTINEQKEEIKDLKKEVVRLTENVKTTTDTTSSATETATGTITTTNSSKQPNNTTNNSILVNNLKNRVPVTFQKSLGSGTTTSRSVGIYKKHPENTSTTISRTPIVTKSAIQTMTSGNTDTNFSTSGKSVYAKNIKEYDQKLNDITQGVNRAISNVQRSFVAMYSNKNKIIHHSAPFR